MAVARYYSPVKGQLEESKRRKRRRTAVKRLWQYLLLTLVAFILCFPFFVLVLKAFMTTEESIAVPIVVFPAQLSLSGFKAAFDNGFMNQLKNTLIIVVSNCVAIPLAASLCAYGFTKCKFVGRNFWFGVTLATMMLPSIVVQIPIFVMFINFGWLNTFYPMIIPSLFGGGAVNIFLIRQFIKSLPADLHDAAKIDGAGELRIYARIVMPLCMPVLLLIIVNTFIGNWNDFMGPLLYLRDEKVYTLGIAIYHRFPMVTNNQMTNPNEQMAAGLLMTVPLAILFFLFQRQLIEGVALTGIKG